MENKIRRISPGQLVLLLFLSRLFSLLTLVPKRGAATGSAALLSSLFAALVVGVAALPVLWLFRRTDRSVFETADSALKPLGTLSAVLMGLFCIWTVAYTIAHFSFFMVSSVYFNGHGMVFVLCLTLAAAYGASLGLEPLARMSLSAFLLAVVTALVLVIALFGDMRWQNVISPFYDGLSPVLSSTWGGASQYGELVLLVLLLHRVREPGKSGGSICLRWLVLSACAFLVFGLLTLTVLGNYGATRLFPLHTTATVAHFSMGGRLDLLYLFLWIFVAFLRAALWLYGAVVCLGRLFPKRRMGSRAVFAGIAAGAFALAALPLLEGGFPVGSVFTGALPLVLLGVVLPVALLLTPLARQKNHPEGKKKAHE